MQLPKENCVVTLAESYINSLDQGLLGDNSEVVHTEFIWEELEELSCLTPRIPFKAMEQLLRGGH